MESLAVWFEKTDAGRQEVVSRARALDRRARALLIMVDGRTNTSDLVSRANQLGLEAEAILSLWQAGYIQGIEEPRSGSNVGPGVELSPVSTNSDVSGRKRSLAAARMYLMDVVVRTFGTDDHPIRSRLVDATDSASVEQIFEAFLNVLRETATPSLVAHIEESFRDQFPVS